MPHEPNIEKIWDRAIPVAGTGLPSVVSVPSKRLPSLIPSVPDLDVELLPPPLRVWLTDLAERAQIPLAMVAAPAIVALGSIVGRSVGIRPKKLDDWTVVPNLWGMGVGRPGTLKTYAMTEPLKPLSRLVAQAIDEHKQATYTVEADREMIEAQISAVQNDLKAAAKEADASAMETHKTRLATLMEQRDACGHTPRRYTTSDVTIEKLGELLNENPRGLLLTRDELFGFIRGLDREDRKTDKEFYLESWNGTGSFEWDRIGRGSIHVPAVCLSIYGNIQPGKLGAYIRGALYGGAADDGLLQRFQIIVWPEPQRDWKDIDREPDRRALEKATEVFETLDTALPAIVPVCDYPGAVPTLRFDDAAQALFAVWRKDLELRLRSEEMDATPAFTSHMSKYRSLMPSLALIFHLVDVVPTGELPPVSLRAAQRAGAWCDFLESHARKLYAPELHPDLAAAHALHDKIQTGHIEDGMKIREIYRKGWSGLSDPEMVYGGLLVLRKYGIARIEEVASGGAPAEIVRLAG